MHKAVLRKIYKEKRSKLSFQEIVILQKNIYQQIYNLDISKIRNVHIFLTLEKFKEINTQPIIAYFRNNGKQIIVSKSNFKNSSLTHFVLEEETILEISTYGIPEPLVATPFDEKEIDLVFVPLLISDEQNYRVGYGKGFYDRFLSNCNNDCKKIGLNFFKPIAKISDINKFDFPLDAVIYPKE
ncbi:5-formyltetrahydrofolate cyclo-ligase [Polaribacter sp. WD7]|uniref:5-formyltetrahydrofolate cyclo-ligase n=1 Tax=Polaribacter sp. WD7 TaxID=2269061 RepID=UPI000DF33342|nr:5-formyltetrahydrofolate cyclo-ligase [Polaribacter sp. WD7]RCS26435.1 5-formyltetrahydrofolate cyclo-ligase [Polaribacter sp. WD7]